jgi:hypothetical protein
VSHETAWPCCAKDPFETSIRLHLAERRAIHRNDRRTPSGWSAFRTEVRPLTGLVGGILRVARLPTTTRKLPDSLVRRANSTDCECAKLEAFMASNPTRLFGSVLSAFDVAVLSRLRGSTLHSFTGPPVSRAGSASRVHMQEKPGLSFLSRSFICVRLFRIANAKCY